MKRLFQVIDQTRLGGIDYLLVSTRDGDEENHILKMYQASSEEPLYIVDDVEFASDRNLKLLDDIELY